MDNHRRPRHQHHHILSSFHPSWCFGPSPANDSPKKPTPNDRRSSSAAAHPKPKRLLRFGSMSVSLTSPRVGCMGQIKRTRKKPNPFMSSSSSSSSSSSTSSSSSSKSVTLMKFTAAPLLRRSASDPPIVVPRMSVAEDMDPPLPVVRRPASDGNLASLWKRRCGGGGIGGENNMGIRIQLPPPPPPLVCAVVF